jgi:hypothetical protein
MCGYLMHLEWERCMANAAVRVRAMVVRVTGSALLLHCECRSTGVAGPTLERGMPHVVEREGVWLPGRAICNGKACRYRARGCRR